MSIIKGNVNWANQEGIVKPDGLPSKGESMPDVELMSAVEELLMKSKILKKEVDELYAKASVSQLSTVGTLFSSVNSTLLSMAREISYNLKPQPNE